MDLKEYLTPLLRWWWMLILSTLIAAGASFWATRQQPAQYTSSTTLVIGSSIENPNPSQNEIFLSSTLASTYVNLANRASIRDAVQQELGLNWLPDIRVFQNSNIIDIYVTDVVPERAQAVAAELARQLILRSPSATTDDQRQAFIEQQLDNYEAKILELNEQIVEKNALLPTLVSAREIANLQAEIDTLQANVQRLETNYALLLQSSSRGAINAIRVLEPAGLPVLPNNPNNLITIAVASGMGLVLAALAAFLLEYLDDTIKTPTELGRVANLPVLTGLAQMRDEEQLVTVKQARSPLAEAFRVLRTGIQFSAVDRARRSLVVVSATPFDGKSTVAANLAAVFAQAGNRVLLIDSDLRRPTQHTILGLPNKQGLTNLLLELDPTQPEAEIERVLAKTVQTTRIEGLSILTSGPIPPNPSELLGSLKMQDLKGLLLQRFDYVIFDSPPVLSVTDAVVLSTQVDGVLMVVRAEKSRRSHLKQMVQILRTVNANLIGLVLNGIKPGSEGYGAYYYYSGKIYGEEGEETGGAMSKLRKRLLSIPNVLNVK